MNDYGILFISFSFKYCENIYLQHALNLGRNYKLSEIFSLHRLNSLLQLINYYTSKLKNLMPISRGFTHESSLSTNKTSAWITLWTHTHIHTHTCTYAHTHFAEHAYFISTQRARKYRKSWKSQSRKISSLQSFLPEEAIML